jgi:hypothetical protein
MGCACSIGTAQAAIGFRALIAMCSSSAYFGRLLADSRSHYCRPRDKELIRAMFDAVTDDDTCFQALKVRDDM